MATPVMQKSASGKRKQLRSKILINRAFQIRALLPVMIFAALLVVLTLAFVFVPMHLRVAADPDPAIQALLGSQLLRIELWLLPLLILSASLAGLVALVLSLRVAGPMHRLRRALAKLAVGATEPLKFRNKDEFRELEEPFAGVISRVEELTKGKLELLRFLRRNLEGLAHRAENPQLNVAEFRESLAVILSDVDAEIKKIQMKA